MPSIETIVEDFYIALGRPTGEACAKQCQSIETIVEDFYIALGRPTVDNVSARAFVKALPLDQQVVFQALRPNTILVCTFKPQQVMWVALVDHYVFLNRHQRPRRTR